MASFIPDSAPFNEEQRAWLNGFFAGLMGVEATAPGTMQAAFDSAQSSGIIGLVPAAEEVQPWHDSNLHIADRMELAKDRPLQDKLMAAMAQLDCGSCGYLCQTYGEAIANGNEKNLTLCSPGGKDTKQMIKLVLKETSVDKNVAHSHQVEQSTNQSDISRKNPFKAKLIESRLLNRSGSAKDVRHVAIDISGSGLKYSVGDALGIVPTNCHELVEEIIASIHAKPIDTVSDRWGMPKSLKDALCENCCLKDPTDELLELLIQRASDESGRETFRTMLADGVPIGTDVLDVLTIASSRNVTGQELVSTLAPLHPRLYSIASSMKSVGQEVHLTVGKVIYESSGRLRKGVASTWLADRVMPGDAIRIFVHGNHGGFTIPKDSDAPMIMVGPGTGIAPFIAFLQEREATGAKGPNWLFFGDRHKATDFLYEERLRNYCETGLLTRLDTAFSRDGDRKVYVQDKMIEQGQELWTWLERGAYFFVCGDASRMAADVDRTLISIVQAHGKKSHDEAREFVKKLTAARRYVRDVY